MQAAFRDGTVAEECMWQIVVLIPKGRGDFRGIGLFEVLWKEIASFLDFRLTSAITFHDVIHGLR